MRELGLAGPITKSQKFSRSHNFSTENFPCIRRFYKARLMKTENTNTTFIAVFSLRTLKEKTLLRDTKLVFKTHSEEKLAE